MGVGSGTTGSAWGCPSKKGSRWSRKTKTTSVLSVQVSCCLHGPHPHDRCVGVRVFVCVGREGIFGPLCQSAHVV